MRLRFRYKKSWLLLVSMLAALPGLSGCASTSRQTGFMETVDGVNVTKEEMRLRTHLSALRFAAVIEQMSNHIRDQSTDPDLRMDALKWKSNVVPIVYRAAFHLDPLIGLMDLAALSFQLEDFLTTGDGQLTFGEYQHVALDGLKQIRRELIEQVEAVYKPVENEGSGGYIDSWAAEHPLATPFVTRKSIAPELIGKMKESGRGAVATVGTMADEFSALNDRLVVYTGQLPKHARWEAERILESRLPNQAIIDSLVREIRVAMTVVDDLRVLTDRIPDLRTASVPVRLPRVERLLDSLDMKYAEFLEIMDERIAVFHTILQQEREAAVQDLQGLGDAVMTNAQNSLKSIRNWLWIGAAMGVVIMFIPFWLGVLTGRVRAGNRESGTRA
jgi:hypothetical protein